MTKNKRNELIKQFEILKNDGVGCYLKYIETVKEEQKKSLTKRQYYEWLHEENEKLLMMPYTINIVHHYDLDNVPNEVIDAIRYASDIGTLVKVKQAGLINDDQFKRIKKRIQKLYNITTDLEHYIKETEEN